VQAQILNLLSDLQAELKLAYLFITHNIAVVDYLAHDVAVMYLGRIVEHGSADEVLRQPRHPYTQALLAAVPRVDGTRSEVPRLVGDMPSPAHPPAGCHFHPRCPLADEACRVAYPPEIRFGATHGVRCIKAC
jgi:peptide/nickel transport system ATP-binding protein